MDNSGWNMYVFREGRKTIQGEYIRTRVADALARLSDDNTEDNRIAALIAAGELECALQDAGSASAQAAAELTSELAQCVVGGDRSGFHRGVSLAEMEVPAEVQLSVAEGFAYYALHPRKFVEIVDKLPQRESARVIGLRSIGTTLSAAVTAALRARGTDCERTTVRPVGHPYERTLSLSDAERDWLLSAGDNAQIVIVDEGPGISGSSFLATAEAVERAGVPVDRIFLIGSRAPDASQLRAPDAAERWTRFFFLSADQFPIIPENAREELSGGLWRRSMLEDFDNQPASWTQLESSKYRDGSGRLLYKFHGYGHYGESIAERARLLADAGFGPALLGMERGFGAYELVPGRVVTRRDLSATMLQRIAEYCAFRRKNFASREAATDLLPMVSWNWECEFGTKLEAPVELSVGRTVIVDGRMLPHEWRLTPDGRVLKMDAVSHGDDHFFPGPCDIAWDLAGAIVEWEMDGASATDFIEQYARASGDDPRERLNAYLLSYAIFRMAWSKMAMQASAGAFDESLLRRDYKRYRAVAEKLGMNHAAKQQPAKLSA